jgi:predicted transposase YbfD/YdcC
MAKFKCEECNKEIILAKHSIKVVDGQVVTPEAMCCQKYMKSIKENKGFGGIIKKPNGTVSGKF